MTKKYIKIGTSQAIKKVMSSIEKIENISEKDVKEFRKVFLEEIHRLVKLITESQNGDSR